MKNVSLRNVARKCSVFITTCILTIISLSVGAQDCNAGINEANSKVRGYFSSGTNLI